MLNLPKSTEYNRIIPKDKLFANSILTDSMRDVYENQVERIIWRNKLSNSTYPSYSKLPHGSEMEVFEILAKEPRIDKRLLRSIDRSIPYHIFHVVTNADLHQAWIAEKSRSVRSIRIENYRHTGWLAEQDFKFDFSGSTPKETVHSLIEQVNSRRVQPANEQAEQCSAFMSYFRDMKMTRSYKPVLVLAAIYCGGAITLERAALQFMEFYQGRTEQGLPTENGYCVYCDKNAPLNKVYTNLINMPIKALCNSGYFVYDRYTRVFSFADNLYENLTLEEIDEIVSICKMRLNMYFQKCARK